jgi:hypothetical protein
MPNIALMPDVLEWPEDSVSLRAIHERYKGLLCDLLGFSLGMAIKSEILLASELHERIAALTDEEFDRLLLAPETSWRLLFRGSDLRGNTQFLLDATEAELSARGSSPDCAAELWTALGDVGFIRGETGSFIVRRAIHLGGIVPVDMDSPFALKIPLVDDDDGVPIEASATSPEIFSDSERQHVHERLHSVYEGIRLVNVKAADVFDAFTKVLVIRRDLVQGSFSSGSSGQYTGRSVLVNPQQEFVTPGLLGDAMVHEAIHSVLYMLERIKPWVADDELYLGSSARVVSPWSGRRLRLRPFLQACFVWFGLLNFWSAPLAGACFGEEEMSWLKERAVRGFENGRLVEMVAQWRERIDCDLLEAIDVIQRRVRTRYST